MTKVLLAEDFSGFEIGMFSADVGPHTEYHYLPEAAPRRGWAVACFTTRQGGTAWHVVEENGRRAMRQTFDNQGGRAAHSHPMISAGDFLWGDYTMTARFCPGAHARCGVVVRYHNNRCYTFFGFEKDRIVLLTVQHEKELHVPDEHELAAARCVWSEGEEYEAVIEVAGPRYHAELRTANGESLAVLEGEDDTYLRGKIALLSDGLADFLSVRVTASDSAAAAFTQIRSDQERELEKLREQYPRPVVWKKLSTEGFGVGRNIRFGDLNGDGTLELVVGQMNAHGPRDTYSEVGCITAMSFDGEVLWQSGEPDPEKYGLTNDVAFQVHDIDGDGRAEVIYARDFELVIADGVTGSVRNKVPTPESKPPADRYPRILGDCLFFCDVRGTGRPADVLIKDRYWHFWVLDDRLQLLWSGSCRTGHYPWAEDIDGDGRDEIAIGYALWDHDGRLLWNLEDTIQDHADGIAIVDFHENPESEPKILYTASDEGLLLVSLDGRILEHHRIGHAQNPAVAKLRADLPGLQTVSINFWGNQGILHFWDGAGRLYHDAEPINMGSMCLPINWTGQPPELFVHNPNPTWGGMFDGWGRPVVMFPDDGHPDMCNAVLDLTGDCRDEVVVWDQHRLWVYTQAEAPRADVPEGGRLYRPARNPQYNSSNYQATVSLPGWSE
jgi:hypothetical protein